MHDTDPTASPFNSLPWVVWALALPIIAMEVVLNLAAREIIGGPAGPGWRLMAVQDYAVARNVMEFLYANRLWEELALRAFAYPFVHSGFTHALFAVVILLALGKMVGEVFRWWAVLVIFFGAALMGALVYCLAVPEPAWPLIGAYPAVYGMIGGFTFLLWTRLVGTGNQRYRAFSLIGMLMGIQLLFGVLFGGGYEWIADLAGFATGFVLSFFVSPGGWARLREQMRSR
ncbi:rhomboid family intramembrane serine protease [Pseudogemmobacter faecipullorum]|uniref:Rhomboid family intramembrane serine protease n=1 Tax=Pseudogemmobacter faecipullorum TaxID=2755041 RepID=A0ABS8CIQ3_9RHOB|nr:rhomboid family intramembrane serine protease [Pseudogemmobacter faecipullorum]MCB5409020.1 rhomboid family intramembrane serine protease [Pseudogemmobacter faecipullorum]